MTKITTDNYWISPRALSIQLNAMGDADHIQASVAAGAQILCYVKGVEGLEYDAGHNYRHWPLRISPTYFPTETHKYVSVAIPRSEEVGTDAIVSFPDEELDIYGMNEAGEQVGNEDYYYVWLQGIISGHIVESGYTFREWEEPIDTGRLNSDEAYDAGGDGTWWKLLADGTVDFIKTINHAVFNFLEAAQATIHNLNVTGTLDAIKGYIDDLRSHNYQSGLLDGSGFRLTNDNGEGGSELEVDFLKVRKKATFMELEIREETFVGGNNHYSPAGSIIYRVDYLDMNDGLLGYSVMKVPFLLKRFAFLGRIFNYAARQRIRRKMTDEEWKKCHHFRCYLLADDGTTATRNWWKVGDQPRCQTFNKAITAQNKRDNLYNWKKDHFNDDPSTPMPKYTTIEGPFETSYYWRLCTNVGSEKLEDAHVYDFIDMPYEGWDVTVGGHHYYYTEDEKRSFRDGGSGIPVAGDTIVCMGNRTDEERMNMISLYTSGSDNHPPAIKGYRGIHTFKINPENKVFEMSPNEFLVRSRVFKLLDDSGYQFPVPLERGEWQAKMRYHWYDRVSWKGSIWLCQVLDEYRWEDAFGNSYEEWRVEDVEYGEGEFDYYIDGAIGGTDHYYKKGKVGGTVVYYVKMYTYSEPDRNNDLWLREVAKGTEIIGVETAYAASKSGIEHPEDSSSNWKTVGTGSGQYPTAASAIAATGIDDEHHTYGVYLWTRTKTFYDDANDPDRPASVEYTVVRWGIDADGISEVDSYYLARVSTAVIDGSSDNFPMPGSPEWNQAAANAKWFDTFSACAAANGGVGSMQSWMVWEKTVIIYDQHFDKDGKEDTKPDVITYKSSRIGQDGQIGMEEYYMLAASDDFNTVFGSATPGYDKIGIRWYNQSNPAAERWRLSSTTPNINTSMWKSKMPAYDKATDGNKVYLWNFEQRTDGMGTEYATKPVCIGNHARGIKGVRELYALSAYAKAADGQAYPSDVRTGTAQEQATDQHVWTDEKYDRSPSEALPYQWNWTRTLYSSPRDGSDTNRDAETGYYYEDQYHISAVRGTKGEDGSGTEYIYFQSASDSYGTHPKSILEDNDGHTYTADQIKAMDDFVPKGWSDNPQGISHDKPYEFVSERHSSATTGTGGFTGGHEWGVFSDPKPWSKWGYNGQDGDGTEYVFIRTKTPTAPVLLTNDGGTAAQYKSQEWRPYVDGTGRTDIETNDGTAAKPRCTDDPKGTDRDWPYEWVAKRTMGNPSTATANLGHRDWKSYYECMDDHKMSRWSNAQSLRLDISNEMDMVPTDADGWILARREITTVVSLYDGATKVSIDPSKLTVTGGDLTPTKTPKVPATDITLKWTYTRPHQLTETKEYTISYTYNNVPYTAVLTIAPSKGQPIWQLSPDKAAVKFRRNADNTLTPPSDTVALSILEIKNDSTQSHSSAPTGITVQYDFDAMPSYNSTTEKYTGTNWTSGAITVANSKLNLYIAMFNANHVLLDRETIPVVVDGLNGKNADTPIACYRWYNDGLTPKVPTDTSTDEPAPASGDVSGSDKVNPTGKWSKNAPNRPADGWHLWMCQSTKHTALDGTVTRDAWTGPVRISGATGTPGEDGDEREWIYSYSNTGYDGSKGQVHPSGEASGTDTNKNQADWVPNGWRDNPAGVSNSNKTEYASWRDITNNGTTKTYGAFNTPLVWSHYGERGMDGDGVEYVFMRTEKNIAPVIDGTQTGYDADEFLPTITNKTAAGAESDKCTDDPKGTTSKYMYEWVAKRSKAAPDADGKRAWNKYPAAAMSLWANFSESVVRLDISNEMDSVLTDSTGKIIAARTVETVVHLYDGASEVDISNATISVSGGPATSGTGKIADYSAVASGKGKKLSWTFIKDKTMADSYEITISYTHNSVPYQAVFSVTASKGNAIWQLKPGMSSIPFQRNADNTLKPASRDVSLSIVKIDGSSTIEYTSVQTGITVRYSTSSMPSKSTDGKGWSSGNITVANSAENLYIAMFNSAGTLLDRETVPVVKDGENGKNITKKSETYRYATNNTGTRPAATSSDWKTTKPTLQQGYWLYTETTITWSDDSITVLYTDERNPNDGVAGQDIIVDGSTEMKYYVGDSSTTHPAESSSDWKDLSQVTQTQGKWLWSKATTYYRKASSAAGSKDAGHSVNYNVSYISKDGAAGRAVTGITEYYKATNSDAEMPVPTSDSGWSTNPNVSNWGATDKYLWNYEKVTYSSGTTVERTKPQIVAIWTKDGKGIDSITNYYKITSSDTPPSRPSVDGGDGWDDDPTAPGEGEYLWNYEKVSYTDGSVFRSDVQLIGHVGKDGKGYKLSLVRNNYLEDSWNTYATIGHTENFSKYTTDPDFSVCSVGDLFVVSGESTDKHIKHTATYECTRSVYYDDGRYYIDGKCTSHVTDGKNGEAGHVGRWYYYAGEWDAYTSYEFKATEAPYVSVTQNGVANYYMLDCAGWPSVQQSSTTYTSVGQNPESSAYDDGEPWSPMTAVFKYIISEAIFANFAKLGSFVINGDWMISQNPAPSSPSSSYRLFDPDYPNSVHGYNFIPMYAVDGLTGKVYMHGAYVEGEIRVTNSSNEGVVKINADTESQTTNETNVTIIDAGGIYSRGSLDGFRMIQNSSGVQLQRWNPIKNMWVSFYAGRCVRQVFNDTTVSVYDDYLLGTGVREITITLPSYGIPEGKTISIKAMGKKITVSGSLYDHESQSSMDLNDYDRAELVYFGGFWYWNYMSI